MSLSIEKLKKFFKLETDRNYDNKAVVGGLDKILPIWITESEAENIDEGLRDLVLDKIGIYEESDFDTRKQIITELMSSLEEASVSDTRQQKPYEQPVRSDKSGSRYSQPERAQKPLDEADPAPTLSRPKMPQIDPSEMNTVSGLNAPLTVLSGIGPKIAQSLSKIGLENLKNLLYYFPRRYDDYSELKPINRIEYGEELTILGSIRSISSHKARNHRMEITEAVISDGTGFLRLIWFNQPFIQKSLKPKTQIVVSGKIDQYLGHLVIKNPDWERLEKENLHTNRIVPVYPLTAGIHQRWLRRLMYKAINFWAPRILDYLPENIRESENFYLLSEAVQQIHFPDSLNTLAAARKRLAFDEIFLLQLGVLNQKYEWNQVEAQKYSVSDEWYQSLLGTLPFELTNSQKNAIQAVRNDLASGKPMNRLLQGDVGSGKTMVAGFAAGIILANQAQAAIMAPTSILAEQHYINMCKLLSNQENGNPVLQEGEIRLLVGNTPAREKQEILEGLENGSIRLVVGTHALIEDPVNFQNLQLAVIDEQHRFGVNQRSALRSKGNNLHLLVMTATPIPRSLALTLYGDLDISIMDEMPPGRQPVETHIFYPNERLRAYQFIRGQIDEGKQAFIIYPLVEQGENEESKAAVEEHERLQSEIFPKQKVGLLHGRMKAEEKEQVMSAFKNKEFDILVSTSVIEVGVDVPNATVMVIEGANRFGLAQLHQFRGRVGRGDSQSYCILIPETEHAVENERLLVMTQTNDGFVLAEKDLEQRGPGDFLGTRQSGYSELKLASLTDVKLIEKARTHANTIFYDDPKLEKPANMKLKEAYKDFWGQESGDIS